MSNNQINEDEKVDLLNRIDSLDVLLGDIGESVQDAVGSLESLWSYVRALEADEKPGLFVGSKPKKTFTVGDVAEDGDAEPLPIGSRVENFFNGYWEKTGEDEWTTRSGGVRSTDAICVPGRKILRVGYEEPKKILAVGDVAGEGDAELLPLGSRVESRAFGHWEKIGSDKWNARGSGTWSTDVVCAPGRKILRIGYDEPKRELELGDILFTKEDFEAVPKGHVVVEIVSPTNPTPYRKDGDRACNLHFNLFVDDPDYFTQRIDTGYFYYLHGGKPVPPADAELPLREAFNAWGANAIVEPIHYPGVALTLSPDGAAHFAYGEGINASAYQYDTVRLVAVLDDGKVIPGKADRKVAAFEPGDVVRINGGPFHGQRGHVLRVDLDLDNPYLVRAEGTTGFGRYEADELTLSRRSNVLDTTPGDRICKLWTGEVYTVTRASGCHDARDYEFLMPKRVPKVGDVIDLEAARKLPIGSRVSVPGGGGTHWQKFASRQWACVSWHGEIAGRLGDTSVFKPGTRRKLLRYGHGDL